MTPELTLITRPRREANILASQLRAAGVSVIVDPLLEVVTHPEALPDLAGITTLVTTSANAIHALAMTSVDRTLPLWCVGDASAATAKSLGFQNVQTAGGSVQSLLDCLLTADKQAIGQVIYLRGDVIRFDLKHALCERGYLAQEACLYKTQEALTFSEEALQAMLDQHLANVLFFSPRAVRIFARLCHAHQCIDACRSLRAVCYGSLSVATAADGGLPWREIVLM
ncbi:MAG: uroporphyrinogen-III synthase [Alphaproteobacteria bacterium]